MKILLVSSIGFILPAATAWIRKRRLIGLSIAALATSSISLYSRKEPEKWLVAVDMSLAHIVTMFYTARAAFITRSMSQVACGLLASAIYLANTNGNDYIHVFVHAFGVAGLTMVALDK
jgi:uncharacterized membrane protein